MKRALLAAFLALIAIGVFLVVRLRHEFPKPARSDSVPVAVASNVKTTVATSPTSPVLPPGQTAPLPGETILRDYAKPSLPPENDLTLMSHLMDNSLLLLKSAANRPLSANEDWADLLRGNNQAHERFLPDQHTALNAQGQLVDRWGTPLFFHALGGGRFEIRSAGPDRKLWTADDIHRNADGSFRRGEGLNAPSLLDAATNHLPQLR